MDKLAAGCAPRRFSGAVPLSQTIGTNKVPVDEEASSTTVKQGLKQATLMGVKRLDRDGEAKGVGAWSSSNDVATGKTTLPTSKTDAHGTRGRGLKGRLCDW